jgi:hypothetical protein
MSTYDTPDRPPRGRRRAAWSRLRLAYIVRPASRRTVAS